MIKRGLSSSSMTQRRKALHRADSAEDFSYLRAISSLEVTKGMGEIFAARKTFESDAGEDVDDFSKSHRVTSLDDFVSHSWRNAWWKKGLALNIVLNHTFAKNAGHAVALASLVVCRAAKELGEGGSILEQHAISIVTWLPSVVFLVVLYFGQHCVPSLRNEQFLDKACISQESTKAMTEGISHLHVFLQRSKRLVILWSPDYFTRLWCTWEVAVYCATHGFDAVELMPLSLAVFVTVASAAGFVFTAAGEAVRLTGAVDSLLAAFPEEGALDLIILQVMSFNMFLCCIPYNYVYSMQVESAQAITAQLQKFRLKRANCFDERDREKVTNDVSALFGSDEKFEEHLRANFLRDAEKKMGSSFSPCKCV